MTDEPAVSVTQRAAPLVVFYLVGSAVRVGYLIPIPTLYGRDGKPLVPSNRLGHGEGFTQEVVGNLGDGLPVVAARWRLRYVIPNPDGLSLSDLVPFNSMYGDTR